MNTEYKPVKSEIVVVDHSNASADLEGEEVETSLANLKEEHGETKPAARSDRD
jgi:hypothetical protein